MYEAYKKLIAQQATLRGQLQEWAEAMSAISKHLQTNVDETEAYEGKLTRLPEKEEIQRATKELISLRTQINRTKIHPRNVGMDLTELTNP